ncbi:unnamed protein product [Allacma fusca]|uniref:Carboxylesterase type B domain-containing protein n=1 Tax=Allacma fusca TaxID=39272 RepID=A0A8J2NWW2_9HEXA|nr:unnamed protein product [Allacma fusca]
MVLTFLVNLLCAVVNCAPDFGQPGDSLVGSRLGARVLDLNGTVLQPPLVETLGGSLEGYFMKTISGREIYAFEGIPFAEAPVGERRFRSNHLAGRWTSLAARHARCPESSTEKLMNCLRSRNPVRLVSNQFKMLDYFPNFPSVMFAPVVEPKSSHAFLTETPEEIYARNGTLPVPYIASNVEEEGEVIIIALPVLLLFSPFQKEWRKLAPVMLGYKNIKGVNKDSVTDAIEKYYFKNKTARNFELPGFGRMTTDRYFSPGIYRGLQLHSRIAPTYSSVFNYRGRFGIPTAFGLGNERSKYKVGHSEDLFYVFNMSTYSQGLKLTDPEYEISKFMVNSIVNFAETG